MKYTEVFTAAGMPRSTYVDRNNGQLLRNLIDAMESSKMIMVTGLTKSGKTVLVKKSLENKEAIWLDGGGFSDEDSFWAAILHELNGFSDFSFSSVNSSDTNINSEVGGGFIPAKVSGVQSSKTQESWDQRRIVPNKSVVIKILKEGKHPVVIDDFHYLNDSLKKEIVRAFKPLVFEGIPLVLIAIPHRNSDILKSEREMTGRIEWIEVPRWSKDDLMQIAHLGFPLLKSKIDENIVNTLVSQSRSSPCLMQEFCIRLCLENGIREDVDGKNVSYMGTDFFKRIAESNGREIFDKLKAGPNTHGKKRVMCNLIAGGSEDVYGLILLALRKIKPGVVTIKYDDLRKTILELTEEPPNRNQITFSLGNMSKISLNDSSSSPVVDWEKAGSFLHITDPFFSFFLEWSQ